MAKIPCAVCGRELGILSGRTIISDGAVCVGCLMSAGISPLSLNNALSYDQKSIRKLVNSRSEFVSKLQFTQSVAPYMFLDKESKAFRIGNGDVFSFENLLSFELLEDGQSVAKGGLGRAVVGGLLFGGVGAIVGGVTGGKKTKGICNSMRMRISLKNAHTDVVYINFIVTETKKTSPNYIDAQNSAQKCITMLETIIDFNQSNSANVCVNSAADEILKFKALLDQGIITQDEFDAKKRALLGL